MSKSAIDRLGDRLGVGLDLESIQALDLFRRSFWPSYSTVGSELRDRFHLLEADCGSIGLSGRFGKSTYATVAKLRRMHTRLSRIQDIAGYRAIVVGAQAQQLVLEDLLMAFGEVKVYDRRFGPSHGYRAVHIVVEIERFAIEIQVRTVFQHLWAQLSERLCDTLGYPGIKYGEYPTEYPDVERILIACSRAIVDFEEAELRSVGNIEARRHALGTRLLQALSILER